MRFSRLIRPLPGSRFREIFSLLNVYCFLFAFLLIISCGDPQADDPPQKDPGTSVLGDRSLQDQDPVNGLKSGQEDSAEGNEEIRALDDEVKLPYDAEGTDAGDLNLEEDPGKDSQNLKDPENPGSLSNRDTNGRQEILQEGESSRDEEGNWRSDRGPGEGLSADRRQGDEELQTDTLEDPNESQGWRISPGEELSPGESEALARSSAQDEEALEESRKQAIYGNPPESWEGVGLVWITTDPPEVGVFDLFGELLGLTPYGIELRNLNAFKITLLKDGYLIKGQMIRPKEGFQTIHNKMIPSAEE